MKKNRVLSTILAAALCTSLAACGGSAGGNSENADNSNTSGNSKSNTLSVSIWDNNQLAGLKSIMDDFTKETGIAVGINTGLFWKQEHREALCRMYSGCTPTTARCSCAMICFSI